METDRLVIHAADRTEMENYIAVQDNEILKAAYTEMLEGCLNNPDSWEWYAIWMIEL